MEKSGDYGGDYAGLVGFQNCYYVYCLQLIRAEWSSDIQISNFIKLCSAYEISVRDKQKPYLNKTIIITVRQKQKCTSTQHK